MSTMWRAESDKGLLGLRRDDQLNVFMEHKEMNEAIKLLGTYTAGRFDIWMLAGDAKASCRVQVMSALLGRKAKRAESGINALRTEFYNRLNITGDCLAAKEGNFIAYCKGQRSPDLKTACPAEEHDDTNAECICSRRIRLAPLEKKLTKKEVTNRIVELLEEQQKLLRELAK
jgi:hypothetical protein